MLTAQTNLFSSQAALNGSWRNIQNWINFSLHITGLEGNVWVEVSNDPLVMSDGATIAAPATPVLSQYTPTTDSHKVGVTSNTTFYVKNTYVTPNGGETLPSAEASLLVTTGNLLTVVSPAPNALGLATGWNTYISTVTAKETIQNLVDNSVVSQISFGSNFNLLSLSSAGLAPPATNLSGSPNSGVNITSNLAAGSYVAPTSLNQIQVFVSNGQAMLNPSGIIWNYIRVCKDSTANTKVTSAYLFGQTA